MKRPRDIEVELTFLLPEDGGRSKPAFSDYRPQFHYAGYDWDAVHEYPDVERVNPGETVRAYLAFLSPDQQIGKVKPGMAFLIREGRRIIARREVTTCGRRYSRRRERRRDNASATGVDVVG